MMVEEEDAHDFWPSSRAEIERSSSLLDMALLLGWCWQITGMVALKQHYFHDDADISRRFADSAMADFDCLYRFIVLVHQQ